MEFKYGKEFICVLVQFLEVTPHFSFLSMQNLKERGNGLSIVADLDWVPALDPGLGPSLAVAEIWEVNQ